MTRQIQWGLDDDGLLVSNEKDDDNGNDYDEVDDNVD